MMIPTEFPSFLETDVYTTRAPVHRKATQNTCSTNLRGTRNNVQSKNTFINNARNKLIRLWKGATDCRETCKVETEKDGQQRRAFSRDGGAKTGRDRDVIDRHTVPTVRLNARPRPHRLHNPATYRDTRNGQKQTPTLLAHGKIPLG